MSKSTYVLGLRHALTTTVLTGLLLAACSKKEPTQSTYFDRTISPILTTSCVRTNTGAGCHVSTPKGNAFGNLDTSTFAGVDKRRDLLLDYGPYGQPAFLIKNIPNFAVEVQSFDGVKTSITTDIKHAGGPIFDPTASAYQTLRRWIENGATANNAGLSPSTIVRQACATDVPRGTPGFDGNADPARPDFATFRDRVNPTFRGTCAASNCHGNFANDLYLTCGDTPEQLRWNYFTASQYLGKSAEESELTRRPLAPAQGGSFHEGGIIFPTTADDGYQALLSWAKDHGPADFGAIDPQLAFFAHKVQPILVKKGCMMLQCHSAAQFHDYRLRGGAGGSFSFSATRRNYELSLAQLSVESDDINASRLVRKNLFRPELANGSQGLLHRGGPLFEDFAGANATGKACDDANAGAGYDYDNAPLDEIPPYCVVREWHRRERDARKLAPLSAIVYVKRSIAPGPDRAQDFDVYAPGAELHVAKATLANGNVTLGADAAVNGACGLDKATADIRRPQASWDGTHVAFAARSSASEPLQIYEMKSDGTECAKHADINAKGGSENGLLVHNFDPAYSPPEADGKVHLVFASTRGNLATGPYDYTGPQRTPADPSKPNANLYSFEADPKTPGASRIRQLTFLLNMERQPSFMSDGRLIFTAEKRANGFYQLALRRMNIDGGDFHPLYAQRGSVGYHQATEVTELSDRNFAAIFSEAAVPHGGGTLGVFNRSIGIDFTSREAGDYLVDPSVLDPASPASPEIAFFLHSLRFPDGSTSGRPGTPTTGLYATPSPIPDGKMLVSFGAATDAGGFGGDYDVFLLDPLTGQKVKILGDAGSAEIEAVGIYARIGRGVFRSALDEPNGHTVVFEDKTEADIHVLDMPVLASLLFQNTPTGRTIEDGINEVEIYEDMPPPLDVTSFASGGSNVAKDEFGQVFVKHRLLGKVPVAADGSMHFQVPGGLPILYKLPDTQQSKDKKLPRVQRESISFSPGEHANQSFRREQFNGLCASCHGAISGRPIDVAVQPDILTGASATMSRGAVPSNLNVAPNARGPISGP
jgi:hypothetical protein